MRYYVGFDDTDTLDADRGTGKLARWFEECLPGHLHFGGVVRQQLPVLAPIPYTSHNSAACVIIEGPADTQAVCASLAEAAAAHIAAHFLAGSDPGLCVASREAALQAPFLDFALTCTRRVVSQADAREAAHHLHLSGHGGTCDGIIGAAAAVGLTAAGWYGRFIEWKGLRTLPQEMRVAELEALGIRTVSLDRDACIPAPGDEVNTRGWVRPRLLGGEPVLWVQPTDNGRWDNVDRRKRHRQQQEARAN
jgi:tRNA(Ile2) C34 agmatinyltransferase TiaS